MRRLQLNDLVELKRLVDIDVDGTLIYSDYQPLKCRIQRTAKISIDNEGREFLTSGKIFFLEDDVPVGSVVRANGLEYHIRNNNPFTDVHGTYSHTECDLGPGMG